MTTFKKSIIIEYKPLSASDSIATLSGNQRQTYDINTGHFNPDRRLDPLTLLVNCSVNDPHNIVNGIINEQLTDVTWKITDPTGKLVLIDPTDKQFKIGTGADKGKITIYKNIPDLEETTIEFTAKYLEPKSKRSVNLQRSFSLITVTEAIAQAELDINAPYGTVMFPFIQTNGLLLQADLTRNGKKVPAAYYWKKDKVDIPNQSNNTLPITTTTKTGNIYQVEVADCSSKFNELVSEKVENDIEIIDYRTLFNEETLNFINQYNNNWYAWSPNITKKALVANRTVRAWKEKDITDVAVGLITDSTFNIQANSKYKINFIGLAYFDNDLYTLYNYCYLMHADGNVVLPVFNLIKQTEVIVIGTSKGYLMEVEFTAKKTMSNARLMIGARRPAGSYHNPDYFGFYVKDIKMSEVTDTNFEKWSPSKYDLEQLIKQKTDFYAEQTSLPPGYRPNPKPTVLYKKEIFVKKSYGQYEVDILYPSKVDPRTDIVRFEAVFRNNKGNIPDASKYFDIGWWKKADGTYEYNGLVINVPIAKVEAFIAANKGVEYTVIEKA
ncbi:hypothetical protein [Myroides odoratimimus]|uniref:Ig-like domain-containing protein n=1 Tax=Myroides odoratimimus CIP 101113 TaxID=883154 RepID=A0AAV3F5D8_9FLAO|nr:hypothetical protein [Myroides odoratimimus]EHO13852.1 hypothetical protein HMPREF9715_00926 [Myroides odoratimimus CIP 101113]